MATAPTIPPADGAALPTPPSTSDPANFDTRGDAFLGALPAFQTEENALKDNVHANALSAYDNALEAATQAGNAANSAGTATTQAGLAAAAASTAITAPGTSATSTTSLTTGTGSKALTLAQTGKAFAVGQWVTITDTAAPTTNWMLGAITAFTPGTGAMTVMVDKAAGSATVAAWTIAASAPTVTGSLPVTVVAGATQAAIAGNHYVMTSTSSSSTNNLLWSNDFSNAAWGKIGSTSASENVLSFPAILQPISQSVTLAASIGLSATFSVTLSGSGTLVIGIARAGSGAYEETLSSITLTPTPTRYLVTHTIVNSGQTGFVPFISRGAGGTATTVQAYNAQLSAGTDLTPFVPTTTAAVTANVGAEITLPPSPVSGDEVAVTFTNGLYTNVVARGAPTVLIDSDFTGTGVLSGWSLAATAVNNSGVNCADITTGPGDDRLLEFVSSTVSGRRYTVSITTITYSAVYVYQVSTGSPLFVTGSPGTYSFEFIAAADNVTIILAGSGASQRKIIDSVSVKEIPTIYDEESDFIVNAAPLSTWKFKYLNFDWKTV